MRKRSSKRQRRCIRFASIGGICVILLLIASAYTGLEWNSFGDIVNSAYEAVSEFIRREIDYQTELGDGYEDIDDDKHDVHGDSDDEVDDDDDDDEAEEAGRVQKLTVDQTEKIDLSKMVSNALSITDTTKHLLVEAPVETGNQLVMKDSTLAELRGGGLERNDDVMRSLPAGGGQSVDDEAMVAVQSATLPPCTNRMCRLFRKTLIQGGFGSVYGSKNDSKPDASNDENNDYDVDEKCDTDCAKLRSTLSTWPVGKPKAVVYFIVRQATMTSFRQAIRAFNRHFNRQFRYPIVVFIPSTFDAELDRKYIRGLAESVPVYFQTFSVNGNRRASLHKQGQRQKRMVTTKEKEEIIRFHAGLVYEAPIFLYAGVEYVMRFSNEWLLATPIRTDLFRYLKRRQLIYGFWRQKKTTSITHRADLQLVASIQPYVNTSVVLREAFERWLSHPTRYSCQWEVSALSLWQSAQYRDYFAHVDQLGGIRTSGWSESTIKSIGLALSASQNQIHRFREVYYVHNGASNN